MKISVQLREFGNGLASILKCSRPKRWATNIVSTVLLTTAGAASAQIVQVYADPAKPFVGWMNVFNLPADGGAYQWNSGWGGADLRAVFSNDLLTLRPCTNVSNPADSYWVKPDGSGNKLMDANWYVENDTLLNTNVNFSGNVVDYKLTTNYTCTAFIKVFNASYNVLQAVTAPLTNANMFFNLSLSATNAGAAHVQYGFTTAGANAPWTNNLDSAAYITIRTNSPNPKNALVNPGFESGLAGWTAYNNGGNTETAGNTYYNGGSGVGASNVLVYEGLRVQKVYPLFNGGANYNGVYQDVPTGAGSTWSATAKALTHQQDHIGVWDNSGTNQCWIEVTFRDADNNILGETFRSPIIDSLTPVDTWIDMQVTNHVAGGYVLTAPPGTTKARFQEVYFQPFGYAGGSVYADKMELNNLTPSDPNITGLPISQTKLVGETAVFTVVATGQTALSYQWKTNGVNLVNGGNISGATSSTLTLANVQKSQTGVYTVDVTDQAGTLSASATLTVKTCDEAVNLVDNPSFESGSYAPWSTFNGGGLKTNEQFWAGISVTNYDGTWGSVVENGGEWNGAYQDIPAAPGQIFTADAWFFEPSTYPLTEGNWVQLEIQFRNGGTVLQQYISQLIGTNNPGRPLDTWYNLPATNGTPAGFPMFASTNSYYLVAPANTTLIRYQVTMRVVSGSGGILYDNMHLLRKLPVTVTSTRVGPDIQLSWLSQCATGYKLAYKDNLGDPWTEIGSLIPGDGSVKTASFPTTLARRFYSVITK